MLLKESEWIGKKLTELALQGQGFPLLNVGSSTGHFRRVEQPYLQLNVFGPLEKLGAKVYHLDLKKSEGVDIVGDLTDDDFARELATRRFGGALCSNLLEHVTDPEKISLAINRCVCPGGYILVTVPHLYPYHADPIDNNFRPGIKEVHALFPGTELIEGMILKDRRSQFSDWVEKKQLKQVLIIVARLLMPFYKFRSWKTLASDIPNTFKPYEITCVLLRKKAAAN